jgi:hypothetical protein
VGQFADLNHSSGGGFIECPLLWIRVIARCYFGGMLVASIHEKSQNAARL